MKKHESGTREAGIDRFILNHNGGNILENYLTKSTKLTEEEMAFLRSLTNSDPFIGNMSNDRRTIDLIIDAKSTKKSISEVIPILRKYSESDCSLSRDSVAVITANICIEALENYVLDYGRDPQRKDSLLLESQAHRDLSSLATVLKELFKRDRFDDNCFRMKYFQMKNVPLEVMWHLHRINLILFPNYIYNIADENEAVNHIKNSMIELLSTLYTDSERPMETTEFHMEIEEIPTSSNADIAKFEKQACAHEIKTEQIMKNDIDLWKFRKEMIRDLLTSLIWICEYSSYVEMLNCNAWMCNSILDNVANKALNNILTVLLDTSRNQNMNVSYLSLLLIVPTLSTNDLQTFLNSQFIIILTYKPTVDCLTAISQQGDWTYSRCSAGLTSLIESVLTGLGESCLGILKDIVQKEQVNWKLVVICVSTYLKCIPDSGKNIKGLLDWLLNTAFINQDHKLLTATFLIARQCCLEGCNPLFSSYITWFGTTFGPESPWTARNPATQQIFEFFIQFLTSIVPYEPPACLKVHINKAPTSPPNTHSLLMDYITLAKTRLKDLNEAPGFGLFGPELTAEQDIDYALSYFEAHNGEIAQTLLDASLFRRQHFEQEFLGKLLTPKPLTSHKIRNIQDTKAKFIAKLHSMGKIPHTMFNKYQEECFAAERTPDTEHVGSPELFEVLPDPMEQLHAHLSDFLDCVRGLSHYWESQRLESNETHLPSPMTNTLKAISLSIEELFEKGVPAGKAVSIPNEQIISGSVGPNSHKCAQVVDDLFNMFSQCDSVKSHILHHKFVEIFQPLPMKIMLLHKIVKSCFDENINSTNKLKLIVALVHSIEYLGDSIFPYVRCDGKDITFATYLSECFLLRNAHEMEICFRFVAEYMHYAEVHFDHLKHFLPDAELNTVPIALIKKYLYLSKRYTFAEKCNLGGLEKYHPDANNPSLWTPLLINTEMSFTEWFKQEASVNPFEDFLASRHEYLLSMLTESSTFDSSNIKGLATEVLHNLCIMTCSQDDDSAECGVITDLTWKSFHKDILQVLSMLLETFPLESSENVQPWFLQEWLKLQNEPRNIIYFFRIVCVLPPWLLYSNSRIGVPSESTVRSIAMFVMSHLKNVLCDETGFLDAALVRFLLSGLSMAVMQDKVVGACFFNLLFESCPALIVASRVQAPIVLPIIKKFTDTCSQTTSTLKRLLETLPMTRSSSTGVLSRDENMVRHWEVALDAWLNNKPTGAFDPQVHKWIFFYNVLQLGIQLQSGVLSCKFESQSVSFCYSDVELVPINLITILIAELEKDISVIDNLDIISHEKNLPFCGLSELSQKLLSIAGILLLIQYNTVKSKDTNQFLSSPSSATMLCKVLLSCFTNWVKAEPPDVSYVYKREGKKWVSPLVNADFLMNISTHLYIVLNMVTLKHSVTIPSVYLEHIGDDVIENIFES